MKIQFSWKDYPVRKQLTSAHATPCTWDSLLKANLPVLTLLCIGQLMAEAGMRRLRNQMLRGSLIAILKYAERKRGINREEEVLMKLKDYLGTWTSGENWQWANSGNLKNDFNIWASEQHLSIWTVWPSRRKISSRKLNWFYNFIKLELN